MKAFADLYSALDETTKTTLKVDALSRFFGQVAPADAAWALYFLIGRRPRQVVATKLLRRWAMEQSGVPDWLFQECYDAVGDLAETIALLLPPPSRASDRPLSAWVERLLALRKLGEEEQHAEVTSFWAELDPKQRFVLNKLLGGTFRVGVSQQLVTRGLARASGIEVATLAHRLMGDWEPSAAFFDSLRRTESHDASSSRPYPFCLAHPIEGSPETLGDPTGWQVEWKWDGIRAQVLRRGGQVHIWTRGEELVTERYPELESAAELLPDGTVIDAEILPWARGSDIPLPFAQLQRRIGRKAVTRAILAEIPVTLVAYDLLELAGIDLRNQPIEARRAHLESVVAGVADPVHLRLSPLVPGSTWAEWASAREQSRLVGSEGLMLKRHGSPYRVGRLRGDWWKWKVNPFTIDAVLTAAQRGSGKRASLYTDYTFCLWHEGRLVPIAKAYSGLTDAEIKRVDAFVRKNMLEKFGPVRTVAPELVFELGFEGIQRSPRHKSGIAVRFPRILRWREDKRADQADTLDALKAMLDSIAPQPD